MATRCGRWRGWVAALGVAATVPTVTGRAVGPTTRPANPVVATLTPKSAVVSPLPRQRAINLAWQIALEAAYFSPGMLDASFGLRCKTALAEYAAANFPGLDPYDPKVVASLDVDVAHPTAQYTITADDAALVGPIPADWNDRAVLASMTYTTLLDEVIEKFHVTRGLLQMMNRGVHLDSLAVGQTINVPNLRPFPDCSLVALAARRPPEDHLVADHLTIDLSERVIRAYGAEGKEIALFWCSVAKDKAKLPTRDAVMKDIDPNPSYTFNPEMYPEIKDVDHILIIPPGPRNPVGLMWMPLDLPGYGMHGTPNPELIGRTGSHGCFRMANWDAIRLSTMVHRGMVVKMIHPAVPVSEPATGAGKD